MATKHEKIIEYIKGLTVGDKISVRGVARDLDVSEGTAYRAIKGAEEKGLVNTVERVGTIRVESKREENIETLTFQEVVNAIDGEVLGGHSGLNKILNSFVIGAMTPDAALRYIEKGSLMIVGDRKAIQQLALNHESAVLITGGFKAEEDLVKLADEKALPLMATTYDTFTVASLINRVISNQLIKKEILLTEDIYTSFEETQYLTITDTIGDYHDLTRASSHSRFPVVDQENRVKGIVTSKDIMGVDESTPISQVMTKNPKTTSMDTSVASLAHLMIWDGYEMLPVIDNDRTLIGIVSRQDVMKAIQYTQRQPQMGATIANQIGNSLDLVSVNGEEVYEFEVTPEMTNAVGSISVGVLTELIGLAARYTVSGSQNHNLIIEQLNLQYFHIIQLGSKVQVKARIFDEGRKLARLDVFVFADRNLCAKATVVCHLLEDEVN